MTPAERSAYNGSEYAARNNPMGYVTTSFDGAQLRAFAESLSGQTLSGGTPFAVGTNTVPTGYYLILDTTDPSALSKSTLSSPMIVSTTVGAATQDKQGGTLGTIQLKNGVTEIHKQVVKGDATNGYTANNQPDYAVGDTVTYELTSKTPNFSGFNIDPSMSNETNTRLFSITDTMSKGLTYNGIESVKVGGTTLREGADYDIVTGTPAASDTAYAGGSTVTIDLKKYVNKAAGSTLAGTTDGIPADQPVTVIVKATLNSNAVVSEPGSVKGNPNKVELTFSNKPSDTSKKTRTPGGEVNVYTFKFRVKKTDKAGTTPLQGAQFTIKLLAADNNPNTGKYLAAKDAKGKWTYTSDENAAYKFTSGADGLVNGIDGVDAGTYEVHETKAPEGYLSAGLQGVTFKVTITPDYTHDNSTQPSAVTAWGDDTATGEVIRGENLGAQVVRDGSITYQFDVWNAKSFTQLPLTGAAGMRMLTILAVVAVAAGALLTIRARRIRANI